MSSGGGVAVGVGVGGRDTGGRRTTGGVTGGSCVTGKGLVGGRAGRGAAVSVVGGGVAVSVGTSATDAEGAIGGVTAAVVGGDGTAADGAAVCTGAVLPSPALAVAEDDPVALEASLPSRRGNPSRMPPTMATEAAAPPHRILSRRLRRARVISDRRPDDGCAGELVLGGIDTAEEDVVVAPPTPMMMSRSSSSVRLGSLCASHARTASRCWPMSCPSTF